MATAYPDGDNNSELIEAFQNMNLLIPFPTGNEANKGVEERNTSDRPEEPGSQSAEEEEEEKEGGDSHGSEGGEPELCVRCGTPKMVPGVDFCFCDAHLKVGHGESILCGNEGPRDGPCDDIESLERQILDLWKSKGGDINRVELQNKLSEIGFLGEARAMEKRKTVGSKEWSDVCGDLQQDEQRLHATAWKFLFVLYTNLKREYNIPRSLVQATTVHPLSAVFFPFDWIYLEPQEPMFVLMRQQWFAECIKISASYRHPLALHALYTHEWDTRAISEGELSPESLVILGELEVELEAIFHGRHGVYQCLQKGMFDLSSESLCYDAFLIAMVLRTCHQWNFWQYGQAGNDKQQQQQQQKRIEERLPVLAKVVVETLYTLGVDRGYPLALRAFKCQMGSLFESEVRSKGVGLTDQIVYCRQAFNLFYSRGILDWVSLMEVIHTWWEEESEVDGRVEWNNERRIEFFRRFLAGLPMKHQGQVYLKLANLYHPFASIQPEFLKLAVEYYWAGSEFNGITSGYEKALRCLQDTGFARMVTASSPGFGSNEKAPFFSNLDDETLFRELAENMIAEGDPQGYGYLGIWHLVADQGQGTEECQRVWNMDREIGKVFQRDYAFLLRHNRVSG